VDFKISHPHEKEFEDLEDDLKKAAKERKE
jgi:hypothetical protein